MIVISIIIITIVTRVTITIGITITAPATPIIYLFTDAHMSSVMKHIFLIRI